MSCFKLKLLGFIALAAIIVHSPQGLSNEATGLIQFEAGQSFPQNELTEFFAAGTAYRFKIFGGAKMKLGAVGLGWDVTYADYQLKDELQGHYKRIVWDWFFLPIRIGFFEITPGVAWVITDIRVDQWRLKEQSVRPAASLGLGLRFNLMQHLALSAQVRGEKVWEDMETVTGLNRQEIDITGDYITATAGAVFFF